MIGKLAWVFLAAVTLVRASPASDKLTATGIDEFTAAFRAWDGGRFGKAAGIFNEAAAIDPKSTVCLHWRGTALFHQLLHLKNPPSGKPDPKAVGAAMEAAIAALEKALEADATNAESHAMLGTLYGMKIGGSIVGAIRFGPSVQEHQQQALKYGATNPRVRYLLGTGQLHTANSAADQLEALNTLLAAEKLFGHEAKSPPKPLAQRWGYSSCLTFIGRAFEKLGRREEALVYYRKALAAHPADHAAANGIRQLTTR